MPDEEITRTLRFEAMRKGLLEGVDPAADEELFPSAFSPDLENVRVVNGAIATRLGMATWQPGSSNLPGSGVVRWLANVYHSSGTIYRLVARGGTLYQATGSGSLSAVTGGTGLNLNPTYGQYQGVVLRDLAYLLDRSGALKKLDPTVAGGTLSTVSQPTTPAAAPGTKRRPWAVLEAWDGSNPNAPNGWTGSSGASTQFPLTVADASTEPDLPQPTVFGGAQAVVVKLVVKANAAAPRKTWTRNNAGGNPWVPNSHSVSFWITGKSHNGLFSFDLGVNAAGEYPFGVQLPDVDNNYIFHCPIGNLPTLAYMRLRCSGIPAQNRSHWLGAIFLPGNLSGKYKWRYTYYNSTTKIESAPSPNPATYLDFSQPEVPYTQDPGSLQKACELTFASNHGNTPATDKYRLYRSGGVPELTLDFQGQPVWTLIHEGGDLSATLAAGVNAGVSVITVANGTGAANLAAGDWVVLDKDSPTIQELVQVDSVSTGTPDTIYLKDFGKAITDLTVDGSFNTKVYSTATPFSAATDIGKTLNIVSGSPWTAARYVISAVDASTPPRATLSASPAVVGTGSGQATLYNGCAFAHTTSSTVRPAYVDNTADEFLDASQTLDIERYGPAAGAHWVSVAPDGRLWLARSTSAPLTVYVSNLPTALHPYDQEVFPTGVAPQVRQSLLQGWSFDITGDGAGDSITWAGFFHGVYTVLTTRNLYQVHALSQADWNPGSVVRVLQNAGCLAGETVQQVDGWLYWVANSGGVPRVVRWDGRTADVQEISYLRLTTTLEGAPSALWPQWFARAFTDRNGAQYRLCLTPTLVNAYTDLVIDGSNAAKITSVARPFVSTDVNRVLDVSAGTGFTVGRYAVVSVTSGAATLDRAVGTTSSTGGTANLSSGNSKWLDYTVSADAWEPRVHYDSAGNSLPWQAALVWDGPGDDYSLRAVHPTSSAGYQLESGLTDAGQVIRVRATTKRHPLSINFAMQHRYDDTVYQPEIYYLRLAAATDTASMRLKMGGSEYGDTTTTDSSISLSGTGDLEIKKRAAFDSVRGRWVEFQWSGSFSNRPSLREITLVVSAVRAGRVSS